MTGKGNEAVSPRALQSSAATSGAALCRNVPWMLALASLRCPGDISVLAAEIAPPTVRWEYTISDGVGSHEGISFQPTVDGAFLALGYFFPVTLSHTEAILVKADASGNIVWYRRYGSEGIGSSCCLQETEDGFVLAAQSLEIGSPANLLCKLDRAGTPLWKMKLAPAKAPNLTALVQSPTGSLITMGTVGTASDLKKIDIYLASITSDGKAEWEHQLGGRGFEVGNSLRLTRNGDLLIAGTQSSPGEIQGTAYITRLSRNRDVLWEKYFRLGGPEHDEAWAAAEVGDEILACGFADSRGSGGGVIQDTRLFFLKLSREGSLLQQRIVEKQASDRIRHMEVSLGGGFLVAGARFLGESQMLSQRFEANGDLLWEVSLDRGRASGAVLRETSDGGYALVGTAGGSFPERQLIFLRLQPDPTDPVLDNFFGQLPGDCNQDRRLDVSDAVCILGRLFLGEPRALPCPDDNLGVLASTRLLDSNGDEIINMADAIYILWYLLMTGPGPVLGTSCRSISGCSDNCAR